MSEIQQAVPPSSAGEWDQVDAYAIERLPLRARWFTVLFALAGAVDVYFSVYLRWRRTGTWDWSTAREDITGVLVCTAILIYLQVIKRRSITSLTELRPCVLIPEQKYERCARRMLQANPLIELALLAAAAIVFFLVDVLEDSQFGPVSRWLTWDWPVVLYVSVYTTIGIWVLLTLIYTVVRNSFALRELARSPLVVNTFDPTGLMPFGRLAMLQSLAVVMVVLIPLVVLGLPTAGGGYLSVVLSVFSLAILVLPLWGVHRQIVQTRNEVLRTLADQLLDVQSNILARTPPTSEEMKVLHAEAERLTGVRKLVLSGPSWPFRDYGAVARMLTAVFLPTIVAFITVFLQRVIAPRLIP